MISTTHKGKILCQINQELRLYPTLTNPKLILQLVLQWLAVYLYADFTPLMTLVQNLPIMYVNTSGGQGITQVN